MSAEVNNSVTTYRWELADFKTLWEEAKDDDEFMYSDTFELEAQPSVLFALNVNPRFDFSREDAVGLVLNQLGDNKKIKIDFKLWIECSNGQIFGKTSEFACEFVVLENWHSFNGISGREYDKFYELFNNHENFSISCELSNLRVHTPILDSLQAYHQNNWTMFEQGVHDAIIEIKDAEFKVMKAFFMSQSEVFRSMFVSNFKEGTKSTVKINDVTEETMKQLIKWVYMGQIEDKSYAEELFKVSDKYDIKVLKKMCIEIMADDMTEENAFSRLTLAALHNENQLKNFALGVVAGMSVSDFYKFSMSQEWIKLNRKHPSVADQIVNWIREKLEI